MKFIVPVPVTDAMLISSSVAETDYTAWNAATNYSVGTYVIRTTTHKIYKNLIAGVDATLPENATTGTTPRWLDCGYVNRWKMFDQAVGSVTSNATSIVVEIAPGKVCTDLALLDLYASTVRVQVKNGSGGSYTYDQTFDTSNGAVITDWYDYYFADVDTKDILIVSGLPAYSTPYIKITISAGTAQCGTCVVGNMFEIGKTLMSPRISITDYSVKTTDEFGLTSVVERTYAKRNEMSIHCTNNRLDQIANKLASVRATPCVWVGSDSRGFNSMVIYGYYKEWAAVITYYDYSECSLTIEGLV